VVVGGVQVCSMELQVCVHSRNAMPAACHARLGKKGAVKCRRVRPSRNAQLRVGLVGVGDRRAGCWAGASRRWVSQ